MCEIGTRSNPVVVFKLKKRASPIVVHYPLGPFWSSMARGTTYQKKLWKMTEIIQTYYAADLWKETGSTLGKLRGSLIPILPKNICQKHQLKSVLTGTYELVLIFRDASWIVSECSYHALFKTLFQVMKLPLLDHVETTVISGLSKFLPTGTTKWSLSALWRWRA